jgi:putative iron-regulated protein
MRTTPVPNRRRSEAPGGLCHWALPVLLLVEALIFSSVARSAEPVAGAEQLKLKQAVLANYAEIVSESYGDALATAKKLQSAVNVLLASPSAESLEAARQAWLSAHQTYSFTEAYRFYDGPIDQTEALVNSWPIDENYIDYIKDDPQAGIINDASNFPTLSRELIISLNEKEGKKNVSTGFHAIEFLLWGQPGGAGGAGDRSWRDYAEGAKNAERRRVYLRLVTDLLVEHLQTLASAWAAGDAHNYRAQFLALEPDAALANVLKGMGALSGPEMSGERLTSAYVTKEREEQQDCFSDSTCQDLINDAIGIQNVFLGHYTGLQGRRISGPGVVDLLMRLDPQFAGKLKAQMEASILSARNIPQPFDKAILGANTAPNRMAIKNAIVAFQTESDLIAQAAKVLSIRLNI